MDFIFANVLLFLISPVTDRGDWWFLWATFGWGIGLLAHGWSVFFAGNRFGADWEERKIQEELQKDR